MNARTKNWGEQQNGDQLELIRNLLHKVAHVEPRGARKAAAIACGVEQPKPVALLVKVDEGRTFDPRTGLWHGPDGWPVTPGDAALKYHLGRKP
jgi:hypothetical protein